MSNTLEDSLINNEIINNNETINDINYNNNNYPWKIYTTHLCHDPNLYKNTNFIDSNGYIRYNSLTDFSDNNFVIENKKTDTIFYVNKNDNKKIKFEGITEFNGNMFVSNDASFSNNLNTNILFSNKLVVHDICLNRTIYLESLNNDDFHIIGDLKIKGSIEQSLGTLSTSNSNFSNSIISKSNILNSVIGKDTSNNFFKNEGYFTNIESDYIITNNDLIVNNNI